MFDPFKDFDAAGYLRNFEGEKDLSIVKVIEHDLFRANLPEAVAYLARQKNLTYLNFLKVHHILFQGFYPWAGKDRKTTAPESSINKGETIFSHPFHAVLAVDQGLRLGQDKKTMSARPGEVMGLFAYGHPFLDGNGRTMLLVHAELCRRAGFSISWESTRKNDYLLALTNEIASPGKGILDRYLLQFIGPPQISEAWINTATTLQGLDGTSTQDEIGGTFNDPVVVAEYQQFERQRGYEIKA
ncbi:Fic/DOC family protein [Undibacterium sp. WLX3042]|uniref:Fic/DOC family protein n=1 Tax=Undibacterium sp. WLX3042 TaxID=3412686 RepID=UPI003C2EDD59